MDYIPSIRKFIGHDPMLSVGVSVIIENEEGKILLEKRHDNGLFCLPGGAIELHETVLEALKREIMEETGIRLSHPKLMMILSGDKEVFHYPNGDVTHYVDLIFYDRIESSKNSICPQDHESDSIRFYLKNEIPEKEKLLRGTERILKKYYSGDFTVLVD